MATDSRVPGTEAIQTRWNPTRDTWVALASYIAVVGGLTLAFQVFTTQRVAANFITFAITLAIIGVALPVFYTVHVRKRPPSDLGITKTLLVPSLVLGIVLGADTYRNTIATTGFEWTLALVPLAAMTLAVGFFEAVFFRGWLQLRFEAAFGTVPGLLLAAACYSLYHVGYGMTGDEMLFLFGYGLVFGGMFRLTKNVFVLWPFYTPVGSLYSNLQSGLTLPFEATYGFVLVMVVMAAVVIYGATRRARER